MSIMTNKKIQEETCLERLFAFISNEGQYDPCVSYFARANGYRIFFLPDRIVFDFISVPSKAERAYDKAKGAQAAAVALIFDQSKLDGIPVGNLPNEGIYNFMIGNDPDHWHSNINSYGEICYRELWPGVDLFVRADHGKIKFDWYLQPGCSAEQIVMRYEGAESLALDDNGNLLIHHALGTMTDLCPIAYQEADEEKREVECSFVFNPTTGEKPTVGFQLGAYDMNRPLWIDPAVNYTTFLGGADADSIAGVAVDNAGNAYFVGTTSSIDFPIVTGAYQPAIAGSSDVFITKIAPDGTSLVYSTYLGGTGADQGLAIAIDVSGAAYVTGSTSSTNFPTENAYQGAIAGAQDAFVSKLAQDGASLSYSTYLGGSAGSSTGTGIGVNVFGQTFVAGMTSATNFPTIGGGLSPTYNGGASDGFVSLLSTSGSSLLVSTFLGGSQFDSINGLALDRSDFVYVTGRTESSNFPVTFGAFQPALSGGADAFITKLEGDLSALVYSTYLGGTGNDEGESIRIDSSFSACIVGYSESTDFPVTPGAFQTTFGGVRDAFVTKLSADGRSLIFSTYLGGAGSDTGNAVAVDSSGHVFAAGVTDSANFPITPTVVPSSLTGTTDWFISMLSADGSELLVSYYLGGTASQQARGVAVDGQGAVYVVGETASGDFPVSLGAFQTTYGGNIDGAATKAYFATYRKASLTIMELST